MCVCVWCKVETGYLLKAGSWNVRMTRVEVFLETRASFSGPGFGELGRRLFNIHSTIHLRSSLKIRKKRSTWCLAGSLGFFSPSDCNLQMDADV